MAAGGEVSQIQVVHSDRAALQGILDDLLERRLIACGQLLGPITSSFRWEGSVHREEEWLALLKAPARLSGEVIARVRELHSYEVPEILVTRVEDGDGDYLRWVLGGPAS